MTFSDASFNISMSSQYGQTVFITGVFFNYEGRTYHPVDWGSTKEKRVCYSSYGAEILACTNSDDIIYYVRMAISALLGDETVRHVVAEDSKEIFDTVSTLHEGRDHRLRQTVQRVRDSFDSKEMDVLRWVQVKSNIADALTQNKRMVHRFLDRITSDGRLLLPAHQFFKLDRAAWI